MNYKKLLLVGTLLGSSTLLFGAEGGQGPAEVQGGADQVETMVKIQTSDGQEFEVPLSRANKSSVLKGILFAFGKDVPEDLVIPLENIDAETFTFIVDWLGEVLSVEDEADAKERAQIILGRKLAAIMKGVEDLQLEDLQSNVDKVIKIALAINFLNIHLDAEGNDGEWAISVAATFLADIIRVHAEEIRNGTLHFNLFGDQRVNGGGVCELLGQTFAVRMPYKERVLLGHTNGVTSLAVLSDNWIVSGSLDGTIRVWELGVDGHWTCRHFLRGHSLKVNDLAFLQNGLIVSGSNDRTMRLWNASTGQCQQVLRGHTRIVSTLAVLSEKRIVSGSDDGTVQVWQLGPDSQWISQHTLEGHTGAVRSLAVLSGDDGYRIVSGSDDRSVRVWDASTGGCLKVLRGHLRWVNSLAVLSGDDGDRIISGSWDETMRVWNALTGECLQVLRGHTAAVSSLAVLSNGLIVSGSHDEKMRVWDGSTGQCLHLLEGHTGTVYFLDGLSGNFFASASRDNTVRVWDASTGECLQVLEGHGCRFNSLAVLANGSIVAGSDDGVVRVWSNLLMRHKDRLTIGQAIVLTAILESKALPPAESSAHAVWMSISEAIRLEIETFLGTRRAYDDAAPAAKPAG